MKRRKGARNPSGKEISVTETFQFQERGVNTNAAKKLNKIRIKRMNKVYHVLPIDFDGFWATSTNSIRNSKCPLLVQVYIHPLPTHIISWKLSADYCPRFSSSLFPKNHKGRVSKKNNL